MANDEKVFAESAAYVTSGCELRSSAAKSIRPPGDTFFEKSRVLSSASAFRMQSRMVGN